MNIVPVPQNAFGFDRYDSIPGSVNYNDMVSHLSSENNDWCSRYY